MDLKYVRVESTVEPETIATGVTTVYLRKEIAKTTREDEQGEKITYWTYLEAKLSHSEYSEYINYLVAQNAINGVNDSSNINKLVTGQEVGDSYQLAILEAITDLYEAIVK